MSVLVTGLGGFVGSHCAEELPAQNLFDEAGVVDLRDAKRVRYAVETLQPEAVIHLAAQSSVPASISDPRTTYETNFLGTLNLLEALQNSHFRGRMLYVGSAEVYGAVVESSLPVIEACPALPLNPYAVSKVAAEAMCRQWSRSGDFEIVIARPFNHIGAGQSTQFAVSDFARQIIECKSAQGRRALQVGNIDTTRDFTDVRDIVKAYVALLRAGRNGDTYNVCSGAERSLRELISVMLSVAGIEMDIEIDQNRLRSSDQRRMCGSFAKLHADTGWTPKIPIEQTLHDVLNYWEKAAS